MNTDSPQIILIIIIIIKIFLNHPDRFFVWRIVKVGIKIVEVAFFIR